MCYFQSFLEILFDWNFLPEQKDSNLLHVQVIQAILPSLMVIEDLQT